MDGRKGKKVRGGNKGKLEANRVWTDLPTGIIMEILSWLPLKSVSKCSIVIQNGASAGYLRLYQINYKALHFLGEFSTIKEPVVDKRVDVRSRPKVEVYTIGSGSGSWTSLGNFPNNVVKSNVQIVCFDFENDMPWEVPSPRFPHRIMVSRNHGLCSSTLDIQLYLMPIIH
ncbi:hypothetical protein COLO4_16484 [Corchorus olitorius]|uniref:Uncharacterized protein n=1 Tax=Corchorus olitorius TaxID=93759 RepID=A0A1R3JH71_9ROSI|nr:hypothetical protein COLO4_16484 [Corchorus olitorius]